MAPRSPKTPQSTNSGSTPERRSERARSAHSPRTPLKQNWNTPTTPGSQYNPILIRSDEEHEEIYETSVNFQSREDASQNNSSSLLSSPTTRSRPSSSPVTPTRTDQNRPFIARGTRSDPAVRRGASQQFPNSERLSLQSKDTLPCGKSYKITGGKHHLNHLNSCVKCQKSPSSPGNDDEDGTEHTPSKRPVSRSNITTDANEEIFNTLPQHNSRKNRINSQKESEPSSATHGDHQLSFDQHRELVRIARQPLSKKEKKGMIYFLHANEKPGLLKVGVSIHPGQRKKQHETKCTLKTESAQYDISVTHVGRADALFKMDMKHLAESWWCESCSTEHEEWYRVDVEQAYKVAKKWADWINDQSPYNAEGKLDESWDDLIFRAKPSIPFKEHDHNARWAHWTALLSPQQKPIIDERDLPGRPYAALGGTNSATGLAHRGRDMKGVQTTIRDAIEQVSLLNRNVSSSSFPSIIVNFNVPIR
ncbi:hypothetical protein DM02DRAFT_616640 [Periconia macrospinosa]|uniref:Bacteriophage T5 Orf172 DNA-binding domain-containing protein n=1 Tax=Periconia macrospinosa TaxID=97972 RepID=A0A2V1DGH1_9PLEO|nr:hypothetical protein DM02DRAFT_616640 [Periconia macrospinosa]